MAPDKRLPQNAQPPSFPRRLTKARWLSRDKPAPAATQTAAASNRPQISAPQKLSRPAGPAGPRERSQSPEKRGPPPVTVPVSRVATHHSAVAPAVPRQVEAPLPARYIPPQPAPVPPPLPPRQSSSRHPSPEKRSPVKRIPVPVDPLSDPPPRTALSPPPLPPPPLPDADRPLSAYSFSASLKEDLMATAAYAQLMSPRDSWNTNTTPGFAGLGAGPRAGLFPATVPVSPPVQEVDEVVQGEQTVEAEYFALPVSPPMSPPVQSASAPPVMAPAAAATVVAPTASTATPASPSQPGPTPFPTFPRSASTTSLVLSRSPPMATSASAPPQFTNYHMRPRLSTSSSQTFLPLPADRPLVSVLTHDARKDVITDINLRTRPVDKVDVLDVTDPWGGHWHHGSPYDVLAGTAVGPVARGGGGRRGGAPGSLSPSGRASPVSPGGAPYYPRSRQNSSAPSPLSKSTTASQLSLPGLVNPHLNGINDPSLPPTISPPIGNLTSRSRLSLDARTTRSRISLDGPPQGGGDLLAAALEDEQDRERLMGDLLAYARDSSQKEKKRSGLLALFGSSEKEVSRKDDSSSSASLNPRPATVRRRLSKDRSKRSSMVLSRKSSMTNNRAERPAWSKRHSVIGVLTPEPSGPPKAEETSGAELRKTLTAVEETEEARGRKMSEAQRRERKISVSPEKLPALPPPDATAKEVSSPAAPAPPTTVPRKAPPQSLSRQTSRETQPVSTIAPTATSAPARASLDGGRGRKVSSTAMPASASASVPDRPEEAPVPSRVTETREEAVHIHNVTSPSAAHGEHTSPPPTTPLNQISHSQTAPVLLARAITSSVPLKQAAEDSGPSRAVPTTPKARKPSIFSRATKSKSDRRAASHSTTASAPSTLTGKQKMRQALAPPTTSAHTTPSRETGSVRTKDSGSSSFFRSLTRAFSIFPRSRKPSFSSVAPHAPAFEANRTPPKTKTMSGSMPRQRSPSPDLEREMSGMGMGRLMIANPDVSGGTGGTDSESNSLRVSPEKASRLPPMSAHTAFEGAVAGDSVGSPHPQSDHQQQPGVAFPMTPYLPPSTEERPAAPRLRSTSATSPSTMTAGAFQARRRSGSLRSLLNTSGPSSPQRELEVRDFAKATVTPIAPLSRRVSVNVDGEVQPDASRSAVSLVPLESAAALSPPTLPPLPMHEPLDASSPPTRVSAFSSPERSRSRTGVASPDSGTATYYTAFPIRSTDALSNAQRSLSATSLRELAPQVVFDVFHAPVKEQSPTRLGPKKSKAGEFHSSAIEYRRVGDKTSTQGSATPPAPQPVTPTSEGVPPSWASPPAPTANHLPPVAQPVASGANLQRGQSTETIRGMGKQWAVVERPAASGGDGLARRVSKDRTETFVSLADMSRAGAGTNGTQTPPAVPTVAPTSVTRTPSTAKALAAEGEEYTRDTRRRSLEQHVPVSMLRAMQRAAEEREREQREKEKREKEESKRADEKGNGLLRYRSKRGSRREKDTSAGSSTTSLAVAVSSNSKGKEREHSVDSPARERKLSAEKPSRRPSMEQHISHQSDPRVRRTSDTSVPVPTALPTASPSVHHRTSTSKPVDLRPSRPSRPSYVRQRSASIDSVLSQARMTEEYYTYAAPNGVSQMPQVQPHHSQTYPYPYYAGAWSPQTARPYVPVPAPVPVSQRLPIYALPVSEPRGRRLSTGSASTYSRSYSAYGSVVHNTPAPARPAMVASNSAPQPSGPGAAPPGSGGAGSGYTSFSLSSPFDNDNLPRVIPAPNTDWMKYTNPSLPYESLLPNPLPAPPRSSYYAVSSADYYKAMAGRGGRDDRAVVSMTM